MQENIEMLEAKVKCSKCGGETFQLIVQIYGRDIHPICATCGGIGEFTTLLIEADEPEPGEKNSGVEQRWVVV